MRNKKLLSTVVAGALVATMSMPVMAADGGTLDVDVSMKNAIIRVEVPTNLVIAVDQFEMSDTGSQIYSTAFDMKNKSQVAVKVDVTSTATLDSGVNLVATKAAIKESKGNDAWLAIAAQTADGSYADGTATGIADLTEANANVATFATESGTSTAAQTYYLAAPAASANQEYKLLVPKAAKDNMGVSYAQFYALTAIGTQPTSDDELQAAVNENDVYVVVTANNSKDGEAVTKLEKGSEVAASTFAGTNTYYTAAETATANDDLAASTPYVYGSMDAEGGKTAFRYFGKLSEAKDTWTDTDISKIAIKYDIVGVTGSGYEAVKDDCNYGLYAAETGPQMTVSNDGLISITGLTAEKNYKSIAITTPNGTFDISAAPVTWDTDEWTEANGGSLGVQLSEGWMSYLRGASGKVALTLSDDAVIEVTTSIPAE